MEALTLTAVQYDSFHKYLDDPSYTKPSPLESSHSPGELLQRLAHDKRFDGLLKKPGYSNIATLLAKHEGLLMEYWNAWNLGDDPVSAFRESQEAAVDLLVRTVGRGTHAYNFFVVHVLTTSHAVRVLLPIVPEGFRVALVRQWWLFCLAVYIAELRPAVDPDLASADDLKGRHWKYVEDKALNGNWATDAHFVKGRLRKAWLCSSRAG